MRVVFIACLFALSLGTAAAWSWYPPCWITTTVNYPPYGEFNDNFPYNNALCKVPDPPADIGLGLYLFTRAQKTTPCLLSYWGNPAQLTSSTFNCQKKTKFIIHGFTDNYLSDWGKEMTDELLDTYDVNVIRVNWQKGADRAYSQSAANTRLVAKMLAGFIDFLEDQGCSSLDMHLIGHSLGAHISGQTGQATRGLVGRISGLDPAGPYFNEEEDVVRLDRTDAQFVDVIHTDGEHVIKLGFGMLRRMGDVDFLPEGGFEQEACPKSIWDNISDLITDFSGATANIACSHSRAHKYFTQSIKKCLYEAHYCPDYQTYLAGNCACTWMYPCNYMGYHANHYYGGTYYIKVSGTDPYCAAPTT